MAWVQAAESLRGESDFRRHIEAYEAVYRKPAQPPFEPLWYSEMHKGARPQLAKAIAERGLDSYETFHRWSVTHRADFWAYTIYEQLRIAFRVRPDQILVFPTQDIAQPLWLAGAQWNILETIFRWQGEAIVYYPEAGQPVSLSYAALREKVYQVAGALEAEGLRPGDVIALCMPFHLEAALLYLGAIWAGLVVATIPDSLSGEEIATRLRIAKPRCLFIQDVIWREGKALPLYERLSAYGLPKTYLLAGGSQLQARLRNNTHPMERFWEQGMIKAEPYLAHASDGLGILFSSGTTAEPKAILWTHLTAIKAAADGYYYHDLRPGARISWPTNLGWMMGPWLLFAGLVNGATVCLYGGPPVGRGFCEFVQQARLTVLGVVPSLVRRWIESQAWDGLDWSGLQLLSSTGEASNPWHMWQLMAKVGYKPIIEYCGGTEIGGGYITSTLLHPNAPSQFSAPALGLDFVLLDEAGMPSSEGELFLVPPSIGLSQVLLNANHEAVYYADTPPIQPGWQGATEAGIPTAYEGIPMRLRRHGDYMQRLPSGRWLSGGRADDAMNLGGIKVSSTEIERVVSQIEGVSEAAAIAVPPAGGGPDNLVLFLVLQAGQFTEPTHWKRQVAQVIREKLSPLYHVADVVIVSELPRTASNKVMRRLLRKQYVEKAALG